MQASIGGYAVAIDETDISWGIDRRHKYAALPSVNFQTDPATRGGAAISGLMSEVGLLLALPVRPHVSHQL